MSSHKTLDEVTVQRRLEIDEDLRKFSKALPGGFSSAFDTAVSLWWAGRLSVELSHHKVSFSDGSAFVTFQR